MADTYTGVFARQTRREKLEFELPYYLMRVGKGVFYYPIVLAIRRLMFQNKPAMWTRRIFIKDFAPGGDASAAGHVGAPSIRAPN